MDSLRHVFTLHLAALALLVAFPVLTVAQEEEREPAPPVSTAGLQLPAGFSEELVAEGLVAPTSFAFLPDGRILFAEQAGLVRLWKDGAVLAEPVLDIRERVNDYWESGLVGLAVDSDFASNGFLYLLYAYEHDPGDYEGPKTNRLSRFTISGDTASLESEVVLLGTTVGRTCNDFPPGTDCIPGDNRSHIRGGLENAADGTLLVSLGDAASLAEFSNAMRTQDLDSLAGKILRITPEGQGLEDNPFWNGDPAANRSKVWAYGVRSPFRMTVHPESGVLVLGEVGSRGREELNVVSAGANLGWPCYEGEEEQRRTRRKPPCKALYALGASAVSFPRLSFSTSIARTVIGGEFYTGSVYPEQYRDAYFFGDYTYGFIGTLRFDAAGQILEGPFAFADGASGLVGIRMGPDELLYLLSVTSGQLVRLRYDGVSDPGASRQAAETVVSAFYGNGTLEGFPAIRLVERVEERDLHLSESTSAAGAGFSASWTASQPAAWTQSDPFSVRWQAVTRLSGGEYQFTVRADDGVRVWLDDELVVDSWMDQPLALHLATRTVAEGEHGIRVEYYNRGPEGEVEVGWTPSAASPPAVE